MTKAVIRRRGEKESCDKEERRRAVARRRAVRVHLDVISRFFFSNYVPSLCIIEINTIQGKNIIPRDLAVGYSTKL